MAQILYIILACTACCASASEASTGSVYKLMVLGQTGTGKSTFSEALARHLGYSESTPAFLASDAIHAHTQAPSSVIVKDFKITDTPGLMDTAGREKDVRNVRRPVLVNSLNCLDTSYSHRSYRQVGMIINAAKMDSDLHAVVFVLSEVNPRFDSPMQSAHGPRQFSL